jgi:hypothetical protein
MDKSLLLKVIAWCLLPVFLILLLVVLAAQWATWLVEYPLLLVGIQILKAYPSQMNRRD